MKKRAFHALWVAFFRIWKKCSADMEKMFGKKSKFFEHMGRSQAEFLKAVRSLIDEKIEGLEKRGAAGAGRKSTKIKVE
jgi:hypothetical protein